MWDLYLIQIRGLFFVLIFCIFKYKMSHFSFKADKQSVFSLLLNILYFQLENTFF